MNHRPLLTKLLLACLLSTVLPSCNSEFKGIEAPVVTLASHPIKTPNTAHYQVKEGDNLYAIAWAFGLNVEALAHANHLIAPYKLYPSMLLKLVQQPSHHSALDLYSTNTPLNATQPWIWPVQGQVTHTFHPKSKPGVIMNQGIDIKASHGATILASQSGQVVYTGRDIKGYGNLIIIKHDAHWLSAYAYNETSYVKEGQSVATGEKIASVGYAPNKQAILHFEVRKNGLPVNPLHLLLSHKNL